MSDDTPQRPGEHASRPKYREFLRIYNEELSHIRQHAIEFGEAHPKVAARLAINKDSRQACPDPFVERLLEGFAYLTARVQHRLESEFPRFTQGILETVYPDYMAPWPAATIARFEPKWTDKMIFDSFIVPRGSRLSSLKVKDEDTTCTFTTAHPLALLPLVIPTGRDGAEYHTRTLGKLNLGPRSESARAALRLRLRLHESVPDDQAVSGIHTDRIVVYVQGEDQFPATILETLLVHSQGVWIGPPDARNEHARHWLDKSALEHVGFAEDEALLPRSPCTFEGHRFLREHFLLPQRNLFFAINGVRAALAKIKGREFDIIIPLAQRQDALEGLLAGDHFQLNCTPVVNLFQKRLNNIQIKPGHTEFAVIADNQRSLDYEVHSILEVAGHGSTFNEKLPFHPFYLQPAHASRPGGFYAVNRIPRTLAQTEKQPGRSVSYAGSEVYLSLVQPDSTPFTPALEQLSVQALCTNRHLPISIPLGQRHTDFEPEDHLPVLSIRCLFHPSPPRPSFAQGRHAWRAISLLSLNYLSLMDSRNDGVLALRELLRLYAEGDTAQQRFLDGIHTVESKPALARTPRPPRLDRDSSPSVFMRGLKVTLTLDEELFTGIGVFPLASVLEQFIARYVSINNYTCLTLNTLQRKEVFTWPVRAGKIPIL